MVVRVAQFGRYIFTPIKGRASAATATGAANPLAPSPCSGLRAGLVEIGDIAGRRHITEPRAAGDGEGRDRGLVFHDLGDDRLVGAVEDAAVGRDEMLRLPEPGEIPVDFR